MALQETFPSWGWWIKNGATTLYENWDIDSESDISLNHIMFGEIGAWFYKGLGGIFPDPENPGFKNIILKPNFVSYLDHFEASHNCPNGKVVSAWKKTDNQIIYTVSIPANSSATLYLKSDLVNEKTKKTEGVKSMGDDNGYSLLELKSGEYSFTLK